MDSFSRLMRRSPSQLAMERASKSKERNEDGTELAEGNQYLSPDSFNHQQVLSKFGVPIESKVGAEESVSSPEILSISESTKFVDSNEGWRSRSEQEIDREVSTYFYVLDRCT